MAKIRDWLSILLLHLMRCDKVIIRALEKVEPKDVAQVASPDVGYLWHCSREYFKEYHRPIPLTQLEVKLADRVSTNDMADHDIDELANFVGWLYGVAETDFEPEAAYKLMRRLLEETRVSTPMQSLLAEGADVNAIYAALKQGIDHATVSIAEPIDPMECFASVIGQGGPSPLGSNDVQYFNTLCQGGLMPGEVAVLVGPTGGFKTTIAIDVACSMAKVNSRAMFMAYEQSATGRDLPLRFASRLLGIPKSRLLSGVPFTAEEDKVIADTKKFSQNLLWFDRSDKIDRVADIAAAVQEQILVGRKPELLIIDQLLPWIQRWAESEDKLRLTALAALEDLKHHVAERYGLAVLVLHQMSADKLGRSADFKPKINDSAEVKGISMWVDFLINLGIEDKASKCFWAITNKHRRGIFTELILNADGDYGRVRPAVDMVESKYKPGQFVKRGDENKVPAGNVSLKGLRKSGI